MTLFGFGNQRNLGALVAEVGLDTDRLKRDTATANGQFRSIGTNIGQIAGVAGVAFGAAGVAGAMQDVIRQASNLNESINAVNVVFGDAAGTITSFAQTASRSTGLAAADFNQLATQTGSFLQNFGLSNAEAAEQTTILAQRAADMASVFNTDVQDALFAINAALRGETEPIRRYAADVTDATLQTIALSEGITKSVAEMDQQEKGLLRLRAVMSQTDRVQGDFVATSDELANQSRILAADWANFRAELGQALIPAATTAVGALSDLLDGVNNLREGLQQEIVVSDRRFTVGRFLQAGLFPNAFLANQRQLQEQQAAVNQLIAQGDLPEGATHADAVRLGEERRKALLATSDATRQLAMTMDDLGISASDMGPHLTDLEIDYNNLRMAADEVNVSFKGFADQGLADLMGSISGARSDSVGPALGILNQAFQDLEGSVGEAMRPLVGLTRELRLEQQLLEFISEDQLPRMEDGTLDVAAAIKLLENNVLASNLALRGFQQEVTSTVDTGLVQFNRISDTFRRIQAGAARGTSFNAAGLFAPGIPSGGTPSINTVDFNDPTLNFQQPDPQRRIEGNTVFFMDANGQNRQQAQLRRVADT